jgi:cytoskeletal protein RodZ
MGLSAADVEEITKIRSVYINALERGNFDELPQPVYILAYIRRLCELYGMSAEEQKQVVEPWCEISFESPDNYSTTVYSDESGDNRKVIRKLEAVIFSVVALAVVALAVFGIILLVSFVRGNSGNDDAAFDEAGIVNLQTARELKVVEPMPQLRR